MLETPAIKISIQRMVCVGCGAEANASCNCGKPYVPKSQLAREAIEANPEKSDRALAADLGIGHATVSRVRQEMGGVSSGTPEVRIGLDGKEYPVAPHVRGTFGTGNNEWYTPAKYVEMARRVLGGIDLDPASSEVAQRTVGATAYFTSEQDGLVQSWRGKVWLNPPYAQPFIAQFITKLSEELDAGRVMAAIVLTHNYTDTAWFHEAADGANAICFTRGRIRFVDETGAECAPTQGQAFFYFGSDTPLFAKVFSEVGFVVEACEWQGAGSIPFGGVAMSGAVLTSSADPK